VVSLSCMELYQLYWNIFQTLAGFPEGLHSIEILIVDGILYTDRQLITYHADFQD